METFKNDMLGLCYAKYSLEDHQISITWMLVRNAHSQDDTVHLAKYIHSRFSVGGISFQAVFFFFKDSLLPFPCL